jgi:hypothetical protein
MTLSYMYINCDIDLYKRTCFVHEHAKYCTIEVVISYAESTYVRDPDIKREGLGSQ